MAISKIILNGVTQMDVTQDTVASNNLLSGETATGADGNPVVGAYVPASAPTIESLSVTPSETQQTYNSSSVDGYKPVTVGAISSTYVGSGITRRSSSDMTASGATVTAPAGYYESASSKAVASGTEGTPTATKGSVSNHSVSVTPSVTNSAGYITGGTKTGTGVSVSASELVSGNLAITQNGTNIDVTNYATVSVAVEGGGGSGVQVVVHGEQSSMTSTSLVYTGLLGEPTSFFIAPDDNITPSATATIADVLYDGSTLHGQAITNTTNANVSYVDSGLTKSYSNGTLTISVSGASFATMAYVLFYSYGGTSANIDTKDVQVGSGATSITFTGLDDEPLFWSCIFKSDFGSSYGYQRVVFVTSQTNNSIAGMEMDSTAKNALHWTASYSNGSLTITSNGTNQGGYFHQPGYYQLTAVYGGEIEPTEIEVEPLSVTQNGTYTAPTGTAYSPVTVNVSGGTISVATTTWTNSDSTATSYTFTGLSGTPKAAFLRCTSSLSRSSSSTNYFVADMRWTGSATAGNSFRRSNGTYANVTSGYSFSASGTSLTVTTSGNSTTNPGSFYNGTYELTYVY